MKKRITLLLAAVLMICPILFSSCDTLVFGSSPEYVFFMEAEAENERYMIWGDLLVDKQEKLIYPLQYKDNQFDDYHSGYDCPTRFEITDNSIVRYTYRAVPKYDQDTGAVAYYLYYKAKITFDFYGCEVVRWVSTEALSEEEMLFDWAIQPHVKPQSDWFSFCQEQGSGRGRYDDPDEEPPTYTDIQQKAVDYAFSLEKEILMDYHITRGFGRMIEGRLYFSVTRCNKKEWAGQSMVAQGIYSSMVVCYDPTTDQFERLIEFDGRNDIIPYDSGESILEFDSEHVLVAKNGKIFSYSYESGKGKQVFDLNYHDSYYMIEASDSVLCVSCTAPCDCRVFMTFDGTVIAEYYNVD